MKSILAAAFFSLVTSSCASEPLAQPEVGSIEWPRDFDAALASSKATGKPVFAFFQEVPGCSGCQQFGSTVMTDPTILSAIESAFVPVLIHNNKGGADAEILKRYDEPAWNYQVVRFLDGEGKDLIPRKDRVWTKDALATRMVEALTTAQHEVPAALIDVSKGRKPQAAAAAETSEGKAAFAMFCFWTGEMKLGQIDGVLTTEAGFLDGHEVTLVTWDRTQLDFTILVKKTAAIDCARKIYPTTQADIAAAKKAGSKLEVVPFSENAYRRAPDSDQKKQLTGTPYAKLKLTPEQATKVNAFCRTDAKIAQAVLTPEQRAQLTSP
jgi:hypothetical protein